MNSGAVSTPHQMRRRENRRKNEGNGQRELKNKRTQRACADGVEINIISRTGRLRQQDDGSRNGEWIVPVNMIMYKVSWGRRFTVQLFVSETEFDKSMSRLSCGARNTRTICFPGTVRQIGYDIFADNQSLRSVVLNEGLERLDGFARSFVSYRIPRKFRRVFSGSQLQQVKLPSTLRVLGDGAFYGCDRLKRVTFAEGSQLEQIGSYCFSGTRIEQFLAPPSLREIGSGAFQKCENLWRVILNEGLESLGKLRDEYSDTINGVFSNTKISEITLPSTLRVLGSKTFSRCRNLQKIYVTDGCEVDPSNLKIPNSAKIGPLPETTAWDVRVWNYRYCKDITIPEGTKKIGNYWFYRCDIRNIVLPASVTKIGTKAFYECNNLTSVTFPAGLQTVKDGAFSGCKKLEQITLNEGLERLGECGDSTCYSGVFSSTQIKQIVLPSTLVVLGNRTFWSCEHLSQVTSRRKTQITEAVGREWEVYPGEAVLPDALEQIGTNVFYNCPEIKEIWTGNRSVADSLGQQSRQTILPARSTMVGDVLLQKLRRQREVVIPEGVQEIGAQWFMNSEVESVTIPASTTVIGKEAFQDCEDLKCVAFASGSMLEKFESRCFSNAGVEKIIIPASVTIIGARAFQCCRNLKHVAFAKGSNLEEIGQWCFYYSGLEEITLPKTLKEIGEGAFCCCDCLKKIYVKDSSEACLSDARIPDSTQVGPLPGTMVGSAMVWDLRDCKQIAIPDGVERIGNWWFWGSGVQSVTIPASVEEIGIEAFYNCKNLRKVTFAEGSGLTKIKAGSFCKTGIERMLIPRKVEEIQENAFSECKSLKEVVLEKGSTLKIIGKEAFRNCSGLAEICLPEGLEKIYLHAFQNTGLKNVEFPASLRTVGQGAFSSCRSLKTAKFNEGLEVLGTDEYMDGGRMWHGVFQASSIEQVELPSTLKRIGYGAFESCNKLRSIALPQKLEHIGKECFKESALESVSLPPAMKEIEDDVFYQCKDLTKAKFSEGLEKIGVGAFLGSGLIRAELPASLRTVSQAAFATCENLQAVRFSEGLEVLGTDEFTANSALYSGVFEESMIERVELPSTLKRVEYRTFRRCEYLWDIKFPDSLEYIGKQCLLGSGLRKVQIPKQGILTDEKAFDDCPAKRGLVFRRGRVFQKGERQ